MMNKYYHPNNHPKSSRSQKLSNFCGKETNILSYKGSGAVFISPDPDELFERMEQPMAGQRAGNTCVNIELVSISDRLTTENMCSVGLGFLMP